jgi:hypothetical protein
MSIINRLGRQQLRQVFGSALLRERLERLSNQIDGAPGAHRFSSD